MKNKGFGCEPCCATLNKTKDRANRLEKENIQLKRQVKELKAQIEILTKSSQIPLDKQLKTCYNIYRK